jgi:microcompartment protein CcmL/EutN
MNSAGKSGAVCVTHHIKVSENHVSSYVIRRPDNGLFDIVPPEIKPVIRYGPDSASITAFR